MLSDNEQAVVYAFVAEAKESFVNFLTGIGDIDLEIEEIGDAANVVGGLLDEAKKVLEP